MKSTGSVVTYLICFIYIYTSLRVHSAYNVYENAVLFLIEY